MTENEPETTVVDFNDTLISTSADVDTDVVLKASMMMTAEALVPRNGIYYLSFSAASGWRGGVFTESVGPVSAIVKTHDLGINPGGEVMVLGPVDKMGLVPPHLMDRLLNREEVETDPWN